MKDLSEPRTHTPAELLPLTLEPSWADLDPAGHHYLAVDLADRQRLAAADLARLQHWLAGQTVPVLGVGAPGGSPLDGCVDLHVESPAELVRAVRSIDRNPMAAAVLVQVLRAGEALDVQQALTLESLAFATLQGGAEFAAWLAERLAERIGAGSDAAAVESDDLLLLNRAGARLEIVLNSPATRNAISVRMRDALTEAFKLVAMDDGIAGVSVSANGPCFSSGGELAEFGTAPDTALAHQVRTLRLPARYLAPHAARYHFHVHRACIGAGIELPAFAGRLTATADTYFQLPELAMGLIPGAGGCVSLPRRIGRQRTAYMVILGKKIPAARALAWGLIDAIED